MPPTPTPLPPGSPVFDLPTSYGLWSSTDTAIQVWFWLGNAALVLQLIALVGLVVIGMYAVLRFVRQFTRRDAES